jgi:hypothetical protein
MAVQVGVHRGQRLQPEYEQSSQFIIQNVMLNIYRSAAFVFGERRKLVARINHLLSFHYKLFDKSGNKFYSSYLLIAPFVE